VIFILSIFTYNNLFLIYSVALNAYRRKKN